MIIGFDGSRAFKNNRTGTENYSYELLKSLAKIDHKNRYIVYLRPGSQVGNWPKNFQFKTIKFTRLWTQIGLALQTFKDNLDVLFIPAHTSPLIHKPGLKTVVTVHDLGAEYLPKMHQLKQRLYLNWITNFQLKNASKLIAVSKATKEDLVKKIGIHPQKIEVIYEGYDQKLFSARGGSSFGRKPDTLVNSLKSFNLVPRSYFLFVGTVQPRKNLERLIKAFARYHQLQGQSLGNIRSSKSLRSEDAHITIAPSLFIVGSKGWLSDKIYELPKKLGIEDRVKFLGYVPDEMLPVLYSNAKALVFPSLFEGFGLPILEAQACGCPVITSDVSSMPEIAGKGALLVNPYNVNEITDAMIKVMDKRVKQRLIKEGLENIKRFSWEECAIETLKVLMSS